ncbi:hypothetical protein [Cloacibacillus sp. An23]|uniref:hypothetical protein n=1 Tax=Cloacibacillus sp. An23 TaxID=1965591 RepID=UPI0013024CCE|nr:hypothetical protein [Cloacibacillus sp. An23]
MIACAYLIAWVISGASLLALAIYKDASWGVYFAILLLMLITGSVKINIKSGGKGDARD